MMDKKLREAMRQTETMRTVAEASETAARDGRTSPVVAAEAIVRALRLSGTPNGQHPA